MKTSTISMEAAHRLWLAHREIEVGRKLLADIEETLKEMKPPTPLDPHHRGRRAYTFGIPNGMGAERILDVSPRLAKAVIEAHIAEKQRALAEACIAARIELEGGASSPATDG